MLWTCIFLQALQSKALQNETLKHSKRYFFCTTKASLVKNKVNPILSYSMVWPVYLVVCTKYDVWCKALGYQAR